MQYLNKHFLNCKAWLSFCLALVSAFPVASTACAAETAATSFPLMFDSRERLAKPDLSEVPRLRFLTSLDFPPFNFADQTGRPAGFQVDLAREICAALEIAAKCQIQAMPYEELQPALDKGEGEAIIGGVAVTPTLRDGYLFSRPFMALPARFLRNAKVKIDPPASTALAGKDVGVIRGSAHEAMLKAYFPTLKPVPFADRSALFLALRESKVDAIFGDGVQLTFWAASTDSGHCCVLYDGPFVSEQFLGEGLSIMMKPEDDVLQQAMDHALLALSRKGRLKELYLRYFPYGLY